MKSIYGHLFIVSFILLFTACPPDILSGCIDSSACNYNPEAEEDDGSCIYASVNADCDNNCLDGFTPVDGSCVTAIYGCMDEAACDYNPEANLDDVGACHYESDVLSNPIEVTYLENYVSGLVGEDITAHVHIRNASCNDMSDLVVRKFFSNEDAEAYFCFNGLCFDTDQSISPNPLSLTPFEEDDYFKGYLNSDVPGIYEVTYRFYLQNNTDQYNVVVISYEVN